MSRKLIVFSAITLLVLLAFAGVGVYVVVKRKSPRTPEQLYIQGALRFNQRDFVGAYNFFAAAVEKEPTNSAYCREAARSAAFQGKAAEAQLYAQKAWENGLKDAAMLQLIVASYNPLEKTNGLPATLKLLDELPRDPKALELRGDILFHFKEQPEAFKAWLQALDSSPTNSELVVKVAKTYMQNKNIEAGKKLLEDYRGKSALNQEGYSILGFLYVVEEQYPSAIAVFDQAKREGQYHERLALEHALVYLVTQRPDDALPILAGVKEPVEQAGATAVRAQARIFLGYVLLLKKDREGIQQLSSLVAEKAPKGPLKEAEQLYLSGLLQILDDQPEAVETLAKARRLIPSQPAVELLYAMQCIRAKRYPEAVASLGEIKGVLERWPPVVYEMAVALHGNRQDREALQVLSRLHKRKIVSKESLELFRDIAFQSNMGKASEAAQSLLEKQFPDDARVQLFRGLSALQQGAFAKAGEVFQELSKKYPEDARFKLGPVQVLLAEGKYQDALQACKTSSAPATLVAPLAAFAHVSLKQWLEAEAEFQRATAADQPAMVYTEYGKLLLQQGKPAEAAKQFKLAVDKSPDQTAAYVGLALIAADDRQWDEARKNALAALTLSAEIPICYYVLAVADTQTGDLKKAMENCQLALKKDPKMTRAKMLQGVLFNLLGQNNDAEREFVQLLREVPDDAFAKQQLAVVYRRKGEYRRALELVNQIVTTTKTNAESVQLLRFELLALAGQPREAETVLNGLKPSLGPVRYAMSSSWLADAEGDANKARTLLEAHLTERPAAMQWAAVQLKNRTEPSSWVPVLKHSLTPLEWAQLASTAEKAELWTASSFCYDQALKLDPNNPGLLNNWAWSAMNTKEFDKAKVVDACRRAYAAFPKSSEVLDTYAEGLLRSGQYSECVSLLNANLAATRRSPQLLWLLAKAYESDNDLDNSLRIYRQVLELQSKNKDWELRVDKDTLNEQIKKLQEKVN